MRHTYNETDDLFSSPDASWNEYLCIYKGDLTITQHTVSDSATALPILSVRWKYS
jgi:hypothetical protein